MRSPAGPSAGIFDDIAELGDIAHTIERRLLHLIVEATQEVVPVDDLTSELDLLAKDIRRCYRRVVDLRARRDLDFRTVRQLVGLSDHCIWLFRRVHMERIFYTKLHLEAQLRKLVSQEAYEVYQELLCAEEQEREVMSRGDTEIGELLLAEDPPTLLMSTS